LVVDGASVVERSWLVIEEATGISSSARLVLLCLIGLLLIILAFLVAFAFLIRRRPGSALARPRARAESRSSDGGARAPLAGGSAGEGALAVARSEALACPTCRRHYDGALDFCPRDARRLVPAHRLDARPSGSVCAACRRAFDPGTRFCPHDASELVPVAVYEVTRADPPDGEGDDVSPTGVMGKICPRCRSRHDLAALFCGRDGSELVAIN
jgi:hypothetical protein